SQIAPQLRGPQQGVWLDRLEADHPNLLAALEYVLAERRIEDAEQFCQALVRFWSMRAHHTIGHAWLSRALELAPAESIVRARLLRALSYLSNEFGDLALSLTA